MPTERSDPFFGGGKTRTEALRQMSPQLIADVYLYRTDDGGKKVAVHPGWGCPCSSSKSTDDGLYDGWPLLDAPFAPGERRRLGFVFLSGTDAVDVLRRAGTFYLWEGHFIGEATSGVRLESDRWRNIPISLIDRTEDFECYRLWVLKKSLRLAGEIWTKAC